jgi:Tol biopolymer transport system component
MHNQSPPTLAGLMRKTRKVRNAVLLVALGVLASCDSGGRSTQSQTRGPTSGTDSTVARTDPMVSDEPTSIAAATTTAAESALPWIAYQTDRSGGEGIWLMHEDGTGDHQIAQETPGNELLPYWSPDGNRLVFATRGGDADLLYEYNLATDESRQVFDCSDPCLGDDEPAYSPNGRQVVFVRAQKPFVQSDELGGEVPSDCSLWIGDVESGQVQQATSNTEPACDREYFPRWSPDGTQLTYWRDPYLDGKPLGTAVFVYDLETKTERQVTEPGMVTGDADWSPDGQWLVFSTYPLTEYNFVPVVSNLYRIHPDGTGLEQVTHYGESEMRATQPRYTPDGTSIMFTGVTSNSRDLWLMPAEGGEPRQLSDGEIRTHGSLQPAST